MKLFLLTYLLGAIVVNSLPLEDISGSGEFLQGLGRLMASNNVDLEKMGLDKNTIDPRVIEDGFLTVPQLLHKYGYPVQIHSVQTPDGYLLEMHRIPKPGAQPVYLQHGIMDSSAAWVVMGPHSSLGYMLSDLGYDVWMGNIRGNRYSRKHIYLSPEHKDFWDFSLHELGTYDAAAMLDYIIEETGYEKVHYVGHSQGTTMFWTMCIQRPGYCDKILSMNALAPIAYMKNLKSPLIKTVSLMLDQIDTLLKLMGVYEFLPSSDLMAMGGQLLCKEEAITQALCYNAIFLVAGYNSEQLNKTMLPAVMGHVPAGSSTKQFLHYGQLVKSGYFRMYDYGLVKNLAKYGSIKPPSYDLKKVTAPVALHYSLNDWLADTKDVARLEKELPNVIKAELVPLPKFNHLDFTIGIGSRNLVYETVVRVMRSREN